MSTQIDLQQEILNNIKQLQSLQNKAHKFTRAHQILPRHRRRRSMSWNFHRLPQSLRPRALKESGSKKLIFDLNKPLKSRKSIRCACNDKKQRFISKKCIVNKLYMNSDDKQLYCCKYVERSQQKLIRYSLRLPTQNLPLYDRTTNLYITFNADQIQDTQVTKIGQFTYLYQNKPFEFYPQFNIGIVYSFDYNTIRQILVNPRISQFNSFIIFGDIKTCLQERNFIMEEKNNIIQLDIEQFKQLKRLQLEQTRQQQVFQILQTDYIQNNHFDQSLMNKLIRLMDNEKQNIQYGDKEIQLQHDKQVQIQMDQQKMYILQIKNNINICFAAQSFRNENTYAIFKHFLPIGLHERRYHFYNFDVKDLSLLLDISLNKDFIIINKQRKQWNQNQNIVQSKQFKKWLMSDNMNIMDIKWQNNTNNTQETKISYDQMLQDLVQLKYSKQLQIEKTENLKYPLYINTLGQLKGFSKDILSQEQIVQQLILL